MHMHYALCMMHYRAICGLASAWTHLQIPERSVGIWSLQIAWAHRAPTLTVGDKEMDYPWPISAHLSRRAQRAS